MSQRRRDELRTVEMGGDRRLAEDLDRLVRCGNMSGFTLDAVMHGDGTDAHVTQRPDNPARDLASVRDHDLFEWGSAGIHLTNLFGAKPAAIAIRAFQFDLTFVRISLSMRWMQEPWWEENG
nr:hypothetical protein [Bradyrhizobium genosp. SA-3]